MNIFLSRLVKAARVLAVLGIIPLSVLLGVYTLTLAPLLFLIIGNSQIARLQVYTQLYMNFATT